MKHFILLIALLFTSYGFSFAQKLPELNKIREIKLLEDTREDVRRILAEYKIQNIDYRYLSPLKHLDSFITENAEIEISYSNEKCKTDSENVWNLEEEKVVQIEITPKNKIKLNQIGLDLSKFKKENRYTNVKKPKFYHRKDLGILILATNNEVETIILEPSKSFYHLLCDKELAKRLTTSSSYFEPKIERELISDYIAFANVTNLVLSANEIILNCSNSIPQDYCSKSVTEIAVLPVIDNPDGSILTYHYTVTGGKVVFVGGKQPIISDKVFWDLSDAKPGTYTITAAVDNGCGFCGKTITKTVTVKECADCKKP